MEGVSPSSSSNSPYASLQDLSPKWAQTRSRLISFPNLHYYHHQDPVRFSVSFRASLSLSYRYMLDVPEMFWWRKPTPWPSSMFDHETGNEWRRWASAAMKKKIPWKVLGLVFTLFLGICSLILSYQLPLQERHSTGGKKRDYLDVWLCWETSVHRTVSSPSADVVRKDLTYCFFLALVVVMYIWTCQVSYIVLSSALRVSVDNWSTTAQAFKERELFVSWGTTV